MLCYTSCPFFFFTINRKYPHWHWQLLWKLFYRPLKYSWLGSALQNFQAHAGSESSGWGLAWACLLGIPGRSDARHGLGSLSELQKRVAKRKRLVQEFLLTSWLPEDYWFTEALGMISLAVPSTCICIASAPTHTEPVLKCALSLSQPSAQYLVHSGYEVGT